MSFNTLSLLPSSVYPNPGSFSNDSIESRIRHTFGPGPGIMEHKNDIFSTMFLGLINSMLRSRWASAILMAVMMFRGTALLWDAGVDHYDVSNGKRVTVPVIGETWNSKSGYSTRYRYPGAGQGNPLRFFDSFFVDPARGTDVGIANTYGTQSRCNTGAATLTLAYLPQNPRIHAVVEDRSGIVLLLIGTMCVGAAGALIWNLSRLGHNEAPLVLPGWPATSHT